MELESTQSSTTAKLPMLKQGDYEIWRLQIEQYFQIQDYALWDVIENGNSFKPAAETTTDDAGISTTIIPGPVTIEEKAEKKNDVKVRSMLLMALPNEHLMTFNQYKDAKTLFAAIKTRFGGNEATKKTQKTLLKQLYENFSAISTESLDSIFNRVQKLVSQLAVLGVFFSHEDLNLKFLRSLPSEWNTYVVVWRNKSHLDTMSLNDIYNNFNTVEQDNTGKKITINGSDTTGYDKSKVKCFNCHKMGHFVRECRVLRNQENDTRNQETTRRIVNVEDTSSKAMVAINEASFDWSYMADDEAPTNMAFMTLSGSGESDEEDEVESPPEKERKTVKPSVDKEFDGGYVAFGRGDKGGKITGKGTIRTGIPTASYGDPPAGVPTVSGSFPTVSAKEFSLLVMDSLAYKRSP
uniref:Ribonuclease H-like domain-containing protein n=1 Tax=Tanacetum cinerariifolium TaxID=118510 RepID=A0A6L2M5P2_TANCI|nr:ribonuclease H-like domain-containing protein [Tanacetum cinerariifolium]